MMKKFNIKSGRIASGSLSTSKAQERREKEGKKRATRGKQWGAKTPLGNLREKTIAKCSHCNGNPLEKECTIGNMKVVYCDEIINGETCMEVIKWEMI